MRKRVALTAVLAMVWGMAPLSASFLNFESGHVRPLALSPEGQFLYALNTPDNRLEVYRVTDEGLSPVGEVVVGLEPIAVQARNQDEVWVVNHLSDSVSVVDVTDPGQPFVKATLLVGDEPRDIVFAGANGNGPTKAWAFITTAHRGQNRPGDPQHTTPGVGRADVWVFASDLSREPSIITLFCDKPRALAASPDGSTVYAAAFYSGNQTTVLHELAVSSERELNEEIGDGFAGMGMPPLPDDLPNTTGREPPETGIIVKFDREAWRDAAGRDWTPRVRFNLPDKDVFVIDATQDPPVETGFATGVGTILFNIAVHPVSGKVYVTSLESQNHIRFEPKVSGHIVENQLTIIDFGANAEALVTPVHLNPHIDYSTPTGSEDEIAQSLAFPLGMEFTADGERLYVVAFGSYRVAVLDAAGAVLDRIDVGGGPSGLALDESRQRLYVLNRFDQTISIVDTGTYEQTSVVPLGYNPEPTEVREGRRFLYDAAHSSGHGDAACASCHIFANLDAVAWDLGNPGGEVAPNRTAPPGLAPIAPLRAFHPMKGPMTTQSLRGLAEAGAMHWRGDRNGSGAGVNPLNERASFMAFRPAFISLMGRGSEFPLEDMEKFRDFILTVRYPPNPIGNLDGSLTSEQAAGREIFLSDGNRNGLGGLGIPCGRACHTGSTGTLGGGANQPWLPQDFKIPHLRNLYQKVGMFGTARPRIVRSSLVTEEVPTPHLGDQVRGFGFRHDGAMPTLFRFLREKARLNQRISIPPFNIPVGSPIEPFQFRDQAGRSGDQKARELEAFLLSFDTGLRSHVGQQVTLDATNVDALSARWELLRSRRGADAVVHGRFRGELRGMYLDDRRANVFQSDRQAETYTEVALMDAVRAGDAVLTLTVVPLRCGERIGIDRDEDEWLDRDEIENNSDPTDPSSIPRPASPSDVQVVAVQGGVVVSWSAVVSSLFDIEGYNVYRSEDPDERGEKLNPGPIRVTTYADLAVPPGAHFYRVTALGNGQESDPSRPVAVGRGLPGDCNKDGTLDVSDAICTFGVLFLGNPPQFPCGDGTPVDPGNLGLLDWQPDGAIDMSDGIGMLSFLFGGGPAHPLAVPGEETTACVPIAGCPNTCQP